MHLKKLITVALSGVIAATSLLATVNAERQLLGYLGDVNFDMTLSVADAVLLQKSLVTGLDGLSTDPNMQNADINEDGRIDVFDAVLLRRCILGQSEWKGIYSEAEDPTEPTTEPTEEPTTEPVTEAPTEPATTTTTTVSCPYSLSCSDTEIEVGETVRVYIKGYGYTVRSWTSESDSDCVSIGYGIGVDNLSVTGVAPGTAKITVKFPGEGSCSITINVIEAIQPATTEATTTTIPVTTTTTTTTLITTEVPVTTTTTTALQMTLNDMPAEYQYAADWIWQNRVSAENSMGSTSYRWNNFFDQIVDGKGTLNYVVRWHSTKTITLEQRKKLEAVLDDCINQWTDWLVGYENWPYQHVDVNIVGWAVTDPSLLLDLQPDEIVYTDTVEYVIQPGESSEIPTTMANAPIELSRFDHFWDESYVYPGGLDKRFDQYLWATQGFPEYGGCGGDWGQRLGDTYYLGLANGTHSKHVQIHEVGHGFGFTDFYGGEGASDGFPPGGFPGGGRSIMMAGSSSEITDFDGWFMRYTWSKIKNETNNYGVKRFNFE